MAPRDVDVTTTFPVPATVEGPAKRHTYSRHIALSVLASTMTVPVFAETIVAGALKRVTLTISEMSPLFKSYINI